MTGIDLPEPDLLAIELALGLLDEPERLAAETRAATDAGFADVALWCDRALALFDRDAQAPSAALWPAIAARLPANDDRADGRELRRWRWATGGALAAALVLGVIALRPTPVPPPVPPPVPSPPVIAAAAPAGHPLVALLHAADQGGSLAVSIDPDGRGLTTAPAALDLGRRVAELWVIPAGGTPSSLGVVPSAPRWRPVPAALAGQLAAGATLAVSAEPAGGSPTGLPTGPVILSAKIAPT